MGREQFVGAWRLLSYETTRPDGTVTLPLGEEPIGLAVFTADGFVSAHLMRRDRPRFESGEHTRGTPAEVAAAFRDCVAYFGKCEIDESTRTLATRVEGSLFPNWIGGEQVRSYEFRDGKLVLMPPDVHLASGQSVSIRLTWERAG
jgi:hypothetical protein